MKHKWPIGTIASVTQLIESGLDAYLSTGMDTLQLRLGDARQHTTEAIESLKRVLDITPSFKITTIAAGWPKPAVWNFAEGPGTLGLVPEAYREDRLKAMLRSVELAADLGVPLVQTHFGFVPEEPSDPRYPGVVQCLKTIVQYANSHSVTFCLETGQETPVTLKRLIEDTGEANIGINLDPANLLMYGKGNPCDAVDVFGKWIRSMHIKDGDYPTDPYHLGPERLVGTGRVNFSCIFKKLELLDFHGPLIIEREITGPQQWIDIVATVRQLEQWLSD